MISYLRFLLLFFLPVVQISLPELVVTAKGLFLTITLMSWLIGLLSKAPISSDGAAGFADKNGHFTHNNLHHQF